MHLSPENSPSLLFDPSSAAQLLGQLSLRERLMLSEHRGHVEIRAFDDSVTAELLEGLRVPLAHHKPGAAVFRPADGSAAVPLSCAVVHDPSGQAWLEIFA